MDLGLDPEKGSSYNCPNCPANLQALRNCDGKGTPAKIELNNNFYTRCPKAIFLESHTARYLTNVYSECRENKLLPAAGSINDQTDFTRQLFDFLDDIISKYRIAQNKRMKSEAKKK